MRRDMINRWAGLALVAVLGGGVLAWLGGWQTGVPQALRPALSSGTEQVHKCRSANGQLLYSTEPCPAGSQAQPLQGQVSVVPATPLPQPAASHPLRQLNDPAEAAKLREQRMERVINP